jgi:assimilatory nitrate reductase catalytic subunit
MAMSIWAWIDMSSRAPSEVAVVASVCCYCGTGCGVKVHTDGERVTQVSGDESHPSSRGRLCSKGMALADTVRRDAARVLSAQVRGARGGPCSAVPLGTALDTAAARLAAIIRDHGPDAIGFYLSGQLLTEDYAVFNKLARGLIGTNNIDTNSRLCMSSAVTGYKQTLGADAPPACYDDLELADTVLIAGSNMAFAHPVLFRRLEAAKAARSGLRIVAVDPRRTDTTALADLHLPILPGTDVTLFHAMLHVMIWEDLVDRDYIEQHTEGFAALKARVQEFTPRAAQDVCGVPAQDIVTAARWFGQAGAALSLYTMGLNQSSSGTAKNAALIHLHLATGHIGKPGAGPFSLTGQPNAMGGREAGGMATLLPGHREPQNPRHRREVAEIWGVDRLPETPGLPALDMFDAVLDGRIKALWIAATNPAQSLPDQNRVRSALEKAELVIVQEAFAGTETLAYADIVLPAATWPEKDGTVTNSERRISRVRAAVPPPGDAQPDWRLACEMAQRLARHIAPDKARLFDYAGESNVFAEHARTTQGRDLDYSGLDYRILEQSGPQQWPFPADAAARAQGAGKAAAQAAAPSSRRLYADGVFPTPSGRARFVDVGYVPVAEPVSAQYPIRLTTGRLRDQWHTMARTSLALSLTRHAEEPGLSLNPADLARLGLSEGALARVTSRRGELIVGVRVDDGLRPGHAFLPMHWGSGFTGGAGINALTNPARDPASGQPELKHTAVSIEPAGLAWQAAGWIRGDAACLRLKLSHWLKHPAFAYTAIVPVAIGGRPGDLPGTGGVRLRLAAARVPVPEVLAALSGDLGVDRPQAAFDDPARGVLRRVATARDAPSAYLLAGDLRARHALDAWADNGAVPPSVLDLLMGRTAPVRRALTVCSCKGVTDLAIADAIDRGMDLEGLKARLGCGTGCGSCVPEIRQMIRLRQQAA